MFYLFKSKLKVFPSQMLTECMKKKKVFLTTKMRNYNNN